MVLCPPCQLGPYWGLLDLLGASGGAKRCAALASKNLLAPMSKISPTFRSRTCRSSFTLDGTASGGLGAEKLLSLDG